MACRLTIDLSPPFLLHYCLLRCMQTSISPMSQHTELWDLLLWDAPMLPRVSRPPPLQRTRPPDPPSLWQHLYRTRYGLPLGRRRCHQQGTQLFHTLLLLLLLVPLLLPLLPPLFFF